MQLLKNKQRPQKTVATVEVVSLILSSFQCTEKAAERTDAFSRLHLVGSASSTRQ